MVPANHQCAPGPPSLFWLEPPKNVILSEGSALKRAGRYGRKIKFFPDLWSIQDTMHLESIQPPSPFPHLVMLQSNSEMD
jgi:hypothetical protein